MPTPVYLALEGLWESEGLDAASADAIAIFYAKMVGFDLGQAVDLIDIHTRLIEIERSGK